MYLFYSVAFSKTPKYQRNGKTLRRRRFVTHSLAIRNTHCGDETATELRCWASAQPLTLRGFGGSGISMKSYAPGVAPSTLAAIATLCFLSYRPDIGPEDDQSEFSAGQVLLVADVLVGGNHYIESGLFRHCQKFAVFQLVGPLHFDEGLDPVIGQEPTHTNRNVLIKQDAQRGGSVRTSLLPGRDRAAIQTVRRSRRRSRHSRSYRQSR